MKHAIACPRCGHGWEATAGRWIRCLTGHTFQLIRWDNDGPIVGAPVPDAG